MLRQKVKFLACIHRWSYSVGTGYSQKLVFSGGAIATYTASWYQNAYVAHIVPIVTDAIKIKKIYEFQKDLQGQALHFSVCMLAASMCLFMSIFSNSNYHKILFNFDAVPHAMIHRKCDCGHCNLWNSGESRQAAHSTQDSQTRQTTQRFSGHFAQSCWTRREW